jgi:hypothetical protein
VAVEKNDANTINRILADDFALVTNLGKTYTRLIRSKRREAIS